MSLRDAQRAGGDEDALLTALWELAMTVRRQLSAVLRALAAADLGRADAVVRADLEINRLRYALEEQAV